MSVKEGSIWTYKINNNLVLGLKDLVEACGDMVLGIRQITIYLLKGVVIK